MERVPTKPPEDPYELAEASDEYFCPVCGIGLTRSDLEKAEDEYYCPYCSTRQMPSSTA
jgi:DNA-directed RNA polymerase subunit RPC12/RpoP